jgi:hypothetical protein
MKGSAWPEGQKKGCVIRCRRLSRALHTFLRDSRVDWLHVTVSHQLSGHAQADVKSDNKQDIDAESRPVIKWEH